MILYTICHNCYDDYPHGGADVPTTTRTTSTGMPTIVTRMAYYLLPCYYNNNGKHCDDSGCVHHH